MTHCRVTHTRKLNGTITHIGGFNWNRTKVDAISDIRNGVNTFYVQWKDKVTDVRVVNDLPPYLRTDWDSTLRNNLLDLPDF